MNKMIARFSLRPVLLAALLLPVLLAAQTGPMVGTVTATEARFLYRPGAVEKLFRLSVLDANGQVAATSEGTSAAANDHVAKFHVTGLAPETSYAYQIDEITAGAPVPVIGPADGLRFRTRLAAGKKGVATLAAISCANDTSEPVYQRIAMLNPDLMIFGGDTPYIDVVDLPTFRTKHRNFLQTPFMAALMRGTPTVGTWDDHDFGLNNGNGVNAADRRANARQSFIEYRAHDQFGTGTEGIYHKNDLGPVEVFLLDPRWWSQTMASPVDAAKKTCFGPQQWQWIRESLEASRAPFKVLLMGQIWQDKKNGENDDMFTYRHERDALFDFIKEKKIPGVVLVGGDIHVSRHLVHRQRVGYDLHDFVTSPAHTSVIPSLDVTHPNLEWSSQEPRQFLTLTADTRANPATLTGRFYLADGTVQREVVIPYSALVPKSGNGLGRDLRAWWSFDGDLENQAASGERFDATPVNGAVLVTDGGLRGGAVSLARANQQFLRIGRLALDNSPPLPERAGRHPLDDNSAAFSVSLWCKSTTLPAHGSAHRHFLLESALGGSSSPGYGLSLGFRSAPEDDTKVSLEIFTVTLQPAGSASTAAPTPLAQGPFAVELDRTLFLNRWAHVAYTFDSTTLRLSVDGTEVATHTLPVPGPLSETAGLILGGHRDGTGRNFDGQLDEVALWNRALDPTEITALHNNGQPTALPLELTAADTDHDSLPDWWERLHGLDPLFDDALSDHDTDGLPAWIEKTAGTSPLLDDSPAFDYLRDLFSPGGGTPNLVFRHPSRNTLSFKIKLRESENLQAWTLRPPAANTQAHSDQNNLRFQIDHTSAPAAFFRLESDP